ncbi:hypothetical protein MTO96_005897 [Rhipicephalus appendiculatus]
MIEVTSAKDQRWHQMAVALPKLPAHDATAAIRASPNGCCSIYEYCISCCMHPQKITILQKILGKASDTFKMLVASITDHFELCLTKCRTSSDSVHHENSYRDPKAKHCYADEPPGQQMSTRSQLMKE